MLVDMARVLSPEQLANVIHDAAFRRRFSLRATTTSVRRHVIARLRAALP